MESEYEEDERFWAEAARLTALHESVREWEELEGSSSFARSVRYFQFLAWPDRDEPSALERWHHLADRVRLAFGPDNEGHFGLEYIPADERAHHPCQRPLRGMSRLTGETMADVYASMLHSQENLYLEGFTVRVTPLGTAMPDLRVGGNGRPHGAALIPQRFKDAALGLGCHPLEGRYADRERLNRCCGPRALLLAKDGERYLDPKGRYRGEWADALDRLVNDAEALAESVDLPDGRMALQHLGSFLSLPAWSHHRIVVFNACKKVLLCQAGGMWTWPADQDRTAPDPATLHLFLDAWGEGHYWWIQFPRLLLDRLGRDKRYANCYACFQHLHADRLRSHVCRLDGCTVYQCDICRSFFTSQEGLQAHRNEAVDYAFPCEACGRSKFNGLTCFEAHVEANCQTRQLPAGVTWLHCGGCMRRFRSDLVHDCLDFGRCTNCDHAYADAVDRHRHTCYLQPLDAYWSPITYKEREEGSHEAVQVETHWTYDFETTRGLRLAPGVFRHEVMAWAVCLFVPDDRVRKLLREQAYKDHYRRIASEAEAVHPDITYSDRLQHHPDYVFVSGMRLESFVYVTENVLVTQIGACKHRPVLWAHNGSKFDAKFVLDYYLNVARLELAGSVYEQEWGPRRVPVRKGEEIRWKEQRNVKRRDVVQVSGIGSKILQLKVRGVTYRCSHAHHAMPLRKLPAVFGLPKDLVAKGEFPYALLHRENWGLVLKGMPALEHYDIDSMEGGRRLEVARWWCDEQRRLRVPRDEIVEGLRKVRADDAVALPADYVGSAAEVGEWRFHTELWDYLTKDVLVLARCMEAYHRKAVELHASLWVSHPDRRGKVVSPLSCTTSPSFALRMYRTWFMPLNAMAVLKKDEADFVRASLRGGRTDKRAHYVELKRPEDSIAYVDFVSLYPSVMDCPVHADPRDGFEGTHYPVGPARRHTWDWECDNAALVTRMGDRTGFLKVDTRCLRYVTHPTLHVKGSFDPDSREEKLVFANVDQVGQIYAWPELQEAIRCGEVEVLKVHEVVLFDKGHDLFADYIHFFYAVKHRAGVEKNAGLKAMAKLLLNSLWGKLGQRSYATREWVIDKARLDYLFRKFERKELELVRFVDREVDRVWLEYRHTVDAGNLNNTAVQVAAFVSMWGRVILHRKLLSVHGQRVLYCDTDSAIVYLRPGDVIEGLGDDLGMLQNEVESILEKAGFAKGVDYVEAFVREAVFVAPKTYALRIGCKAKTAFVYDKVVCKGFEPSFANRKEIHFDSMKDLVWSEYGLKAFVGSKRRLTEAEKTFGKRAFVQDGGRVGFVSSMATNEIAPTERVLVKKMYGKYTKGETIAHMPRLVKPFGLAAPLRTFLDDDGEGGVFD